MNKLLIYCGIYLCSLFLAAISQIMLKVSAKKEYPSKLREYLNPLVISAYVLFFCCTFITMYALKVVPLSLAPILGTSEYIFVAILSRVVLKERLSKRKLAGLAVIMTGIIIYAI